MKRNKIVAQVAAGVVLLVLAGCGDDEGGGGGAGGPFTELPALSLTGVDHCSLAWGDCDNDGDLDLAVAGASGFPAITTVYENDGAGGFAEFPGLSFTGVIECSLAWGDCDNDGDLDLAVAGWAASGPPLFTTVYENLGAGGFTEFPGLSLTGVRYCSLAWGDADNDGDLDLAVAGWGAIDTTVYENDGLGGFAEFPGPSLTGVSYCSLAWGDCDNDGDLDLAVAGQDIGFTPITKVYENDGAGGFAEFSGLSLTGVWQCSLAWGDCDSDGDLDLAVAGGSVGGLITTIYENDGAGGFEFPGLSLPGVGSCSLAWGDCDNDGDLDLAVAGRNAAGVRITTVYENDGAGGFAELASLTGVANCSLVWGDCDNDGDLDLAVAGWTGSVAITTVYENNCPLPNVPPEAPTGVVATPAAGEVFLSWNEGLDAETPTPGLSYNLKVVGVPSTPEKFPAMAGADGRRLVPALGPVPHSPSTVGWTLNLPAGVYCFQAQAIDSSLEGGPWSEPIPFAVP